MNRKVTLRGFTRYDFTDLYGAECSIQKSSLATEDAIWFGVDEPPPDTDHAKSGCWGRMHLTQDQVAELLPLLQKFVDTGELP